MSSNKEARERLERIYGKGCMFKKASIEKFIEKKTTMKTYKKFKQEKRYTPKEIGKLEKLMSYHHLKHKSENAKATVENGAIVNILAHRYLHNLPRQQEEVINQKLREYKRKIDNGEMVELPVRFADYESEIEVRAMVFEAPKQKYNRAKVKREFEKRIEEELEC